MRREARFVTVDGEQVWVRVHSPAAAPALVYLPGIHGDWTLAPSFRDALAGRVRFVELTYPRTTTWSLDGYAAAIEHALAEAGVTRGWLLGESFGSQPAWQLIGRQLAGRSAFRADGLILAGGFVKHPWPRAARLMREVMARAPRRALRASLRVQEKLAGLRHRHAPATRASVAEFIRNRLHPDDTKAWCHRYNLVAEADLRPVARQFTGPVFQLSGLADPIVPAPLVRRWLRRHCPGFRGGKTIWFADHNVLGTAPAAAAETVLRWLRAV